MNVDIKKFYFPYGLLKLSGYTVDFFGKKLRTDFPITAAIDFLAKNRTYDCSKAKNMLGYEAKIGIKEGVRKTVDWYEKERYL